MAKKPDEDRDYSDEALTARGVPQERWDIVRQYPSPTGWVSSSGVKVGDPADYPDSDEKKRPR
jgi:hypothetical protein